MNTDKVSRIDHTRTWLELEALKLGTQSQRDRWRDNLLPEEEILKLARDELYKPLADIPRWTKTHKLKPHDVRHMTDCALVAHTVQMSVEPAGALDENAYESLRRVRDAIKVALDHPWCQTADLGFAVLPRMHVAECLLCHAKEYRFSVLVTCKWADRILTREYAL